MKLQGRHTRTIWTDGDRVATLDQRVLPHAIETLHLHTAEEARDAIATMAVRGAPLIGVTAAFGLALAARSDEIAWTDVPLLCAHEMTVPGALEQVVRILLHVNTTRAANEVKHVYLRRAGQLRPDWSYTDDQLAVILAGEPAPSAGS